MTKADPITRATRRLSTKSPDVRTIGRSFAAVNGFVSPNPPYPKWLRFTNSPNSP